MPQRIDDEAERRGGLTAARIIKVISRKRQAPVRQHAFEAPFSKVRLRQAFWDVGEAEAGERCGQHVRRAIAGELTFHPHPKLAAAFLELPSVYIAMCG